MERLVETMGPIELNGVRADVIREAHSDAPKAKFIIHAGDLINHAQSDAEWGEWFGAGAWLNAMIPSVLVPGNHEMQKGADGKSVLSHHWRPQFTLPQDCPEGLEETCYALQYQDALIVSMNGNEKLEQQIEWLDVVLSKNKQRWVICNFHHPIFSTAKDRDNPKLRSLWKPILDKYRVDLVLQGHDHSYGRTGLDTPKANPETVGNGYRPSPALVYPSVGSVVAHELGPRDAMPSYVCVPNQGSQFLGSGYLSNACGPFPLGADPARSNFSVRDLNLPSGIDEKRFERRKAWKEMVDALAAEPADNPLGVEDYITTVYHLLGIDGAKSLMSPGDRPQPIVTNGKVVHGLLA